MAETRTLGILSDIHYASAPEQARGDDYEYRDLRNPLQRVLLMLSRRFIWQRRPLRQNHLLDAFLREAGPLDLVVANGDYSCDSRFVGVSDDAACQSARECLALLRQRFGPSLRATLGDHELGKVSFFGMRGGMRLASWERADPGTGVGAFLANDPRQLCPDGSRFLSLGLAVIRGGHAAGGTAGMGAAQGRAYRGDTARVRRLAARPACVALLP